MQLKGITIRLPEADIEKIKGIAIEGNVSQCIRLLIKKELDNMSKKELISEFTERFQGTLNLTEEKIKYIESEFDFAPNDNNLKIFFKGTGSTNENGDTIYQVFLGYDGYNVIQHICYI